MAGPRTEGLGAGEPGDDDVKGSPTVTGVLEELGLTTHHMWTMLIVSFCFSSVGLASQSLVLLLDAAGEENGNWVQITSQADRLTLVDKSWLILAACICGMIAGASISAAGDICGRIPVIQGVLVFGACGAVATVLVRTKLLLMCSVMLNPFIRDGVCPVCGSLLAEWLPLKWRSTFILLLHIAWNLGRLGMVILWYFIPPAQYWVPFFSVVAVIPVLLSSYMIVRGWRYESPRWLGVSGKMDRCIEMLRLAAESAGAEKRLPDGWDDPKAMMVESTSGEQINVEERDTWSQMRELWGPELRGRLCIIGFFHIAMLFASTAIFFWFIEYLKKVNLSAAIGPCLIAAPLATIGCNAALVVGGPGKCLIDRVPRLRILQFGGIGVALTVLPLVYLTNIWLITAVFFTLNFVNEMMWTIHLYAIEAFPTDVRSTALGVLNIFCAIGSIGAASGSGLLMEVWIYLPMVSISVACVVASFLTLLLREDACHKPLSDTISSGPSYGAVKQKLKEGV